MTEHTVYLITGANRGIGHAIAHLLLQRPNVTVIHTARRSPPPTDTSTAPHHPTSRSIHVLLDEADPALSSASLAARLREEHDIDHLDVVVANAGGSSGFKGVLDTEPQDVLYDFETNALGVFRLFRATWPLLLQSQAAHKKFVLISSSVGSIVSLDEEGFFPSAAYGMSKAAANWFAKKVSVEFKEQGLAVGIIHPGWVQTPMGQALADAIGFPQPPLDEHNSAKGVIAQMDKVTPEFSGKFVAWNGTEIPW
ncbi:Norsolorinic acid ketoreductase [Echria macrotheca]|uniref:Norsolorinic acid ketoreductase n=1 Tax=Echria macrotheca TaxID=438768 RepID=A0AAJ0B7S2_9PEZI|nr:Norsolorinic acid ketoreductase [Echria macrotheca]